MPSISSCKYYYFFGTINKYFVQVQTAMICQSSYWERYVDVRKIKWTYTTKTLGPIISLHQLEEALNKFGEMGWEVCGVDWAGYFCKYITVLFKRPKTDV